MMELLATTRVIIDRPKGSAHPHYPEVIYPYLENTIASDGGGIDAWLGSLSTATNKDSTKMLTGILCTFDTLKHDAEINPARFVQKEDVACGVNLLVDVQKQMFKPSRFFIRKCTRSTSLIQR